MKKDKIKILLQFALNPRFLLCFGMGWLITNGWAYIFLGCGAALDAAWMVEIAVAYLTVLWFPFTPEKLFTVTIAISLLKKLFPDDEKTLGILKKIHATILSQKEARGAKKKSKNR